MSPEQKILSLVHRNGEAGVSEFYLMDIICTSVDVRIQSLRNLGLIKREYGCIRITQRGENLLAELEAESS